MINLDQPFSLQQECIGWRWSDRCLQQSHDFFTAHSPVPAWACAPHPTPRNWLLLSHFMSQEIVRHPLRSIGPKVNTNTKDLSHIIGEGDGTPLQCSCLENPMDGGAWWATVHGVSKNRTWLSDFTFPFHFHALEKEMAIHSSVPAWRIPGTAEPRRLPSMGLHRVGHDWRDLASEWAKPHNQKGRCEKLHSEPKT